MTDVPKMPEPTWLTCPGCQGQTAGLIAGLCWDCLEKRNLLDEARQVTERSIPGGYHGARLDAAWLRRLVGPDAMARAEASLGATRVLLLGPSGAGKSSLAVAMARAWVELNAKPVVFCLATDLATCKQRSRFGDEPPELREGKRAPLLILDELGPEEYRPPSSPVTEMVFHRHAHGKPTWITTWQTHEDRVARYGDGFARRVVEGVRLIELGAS